MSIRERMYELTTPDEVKEFLGKFPTNAIFKAGGCHKTMQGFGYVEQALDPRKQLHLGFIRVIESRPASNYVAEITGITHESPQFILFVDGKTVYDVDNWDITLEVVEGVLTSHFGEAKKEQSNSVQSDLTPYVQLLEQLLAGSLASDEFEERWLYTFQQDASPRSTGEFELLNSLYGDVDERINEKLSLKVTSSSPVTLEEKAEQLLKSLRQRP